MGLWGKMGALLRHQPAFVLFLLVLPSTLYSSTCRDALISEDLRQYVEAVENAAQFQRNAVATAEILGQRALEACQGPQGCPTPFEKAVQTSSKTSWSNIKLTTQRAAFVSAWLSVTFGSTLGAYHLGNHFGKGAGVALSMSTSVLSAAIFMPLGKAFLFQLMTYFERKGHEFWKGMDAWSRDRRQYDEIKGYGRRQALDIRQAILFNLEKAVRNIRHGEIELAADKIAEATRVAYRLFKGVHPDDTTVADAIDTFFKKEVELPEAFYTLLDKKVFRCRWPDIPIEDEECILFFQQLLKDWFPERPPAINLSTLQCIHGLGSIPTPSTSPKSQENT